MTTPPRRWETARLVARAPVQADARTLFDQYATDRQVARYLTWRPHRHVSETEAFVRRCEQAWANGSAFPWTLWSKATAEFVGLLEIRIESSRADLGYALARRWWGQGFMTEALAFVVPWALAQPHVFRVWATCDVDNLASARTLERAGLQREGVLRRWLVHPNLGPTPRDALVYAIVKADG